MTPERLAEIREWHANTAPLVGPPHEGVIRHRGELLAHIDQQAAEIADLRSKVDGEAWEVFSRKLTELTGELERARATAIDGGAFTSIEGDESNYTHELNTDTCEGCGEIFGKSWRYCEGCGLVRNAPAATA